MGRWDVGGGGVGGGVCNVLFMSNPTVVLSFRLGVWQKLFIAAENVTQ